MTEGHNNNNNNDNVKSYNNYYERMHADMERLQYGTASFPIIINTRSCLPATNQSALYNILYVCIWCDWCFYFFAFTFLQFSVLLLFYGLTPEIKMDWLIDYKQPSLFTRTRRSASTGNDGLYDWTGNRGPSRK